MAESTPAPTALPEPIALSERLSQALSDAALCQPPPPMHGIVTVSELDSTALPSRPQDTIPLGLFAYGTLTLDAVMSALLDRLPPSQPARAPGWRAASLPGLSYPGLVLDPSCTSGAPGRLYLDLTPHEWMLLDAFENPEYRVGRINLEAGQKALAYLWPDLAEAEGGSGKALQTTWTVDQAIQDVEGAKSYLQWVVQWREEWDEMQGGLD